MAIEVRVQTLGESVSEATVATWFKKPGDMVAVDELLDGRVHDRAREEVRPRGSGHRRDRAGDVPRDRHERRALDAAEAHGDRELTSAA